MASTSRLGMALLEASQAQKHVTVNEALMRIDAVAGRRVESFGAAVPPVAASEGEAHVVGPSPGGDWAGRGEQLAIRVNGGWEFVAPYAGLEVWDAAAGIARLHDGEAWGAGVVALAPGGARSAALVIEIDHPVVAGASSVSQAFIPDKAVVLGVTGRVSEAIGGATSWRLGTADDPGRYGSGIGVGAGSVAHGVTGSPLAYYGGTALVLTAEGGSFTGGRVLLAAHVIELSPPRG